MVLFLLLIKVTKWSQLIIAVVLLTSSHPPGSPVPTWELGKWKYLTNYLYLGPVSSNAMMEPEANEKTGTRDLRSSWRRTDPVMKDVFFLVILVVIHLFAVWPWLTMGGRFKSCFFPHLLINETYINFDKWFLWFLGTWGRWTSSMLCLGLVN